MERALQEWISVREAAEILNYSISYVHRLIKEGKLSASMMGRQYIVYRKSVENWKEKRKR